MGDYRAKNKMKGRLPNATTGKPEGERTREKKKLRERVGCRPLRKAAQLNAKAKNHLLELANEDNLSSSRR